MATCPTCRLHFADDVERCSADGTALLPDEAFSSADLPLAPGTAVGDYRIEAKIGAGGFGDVYSAEHALIGKRAAIKVLHRRYSSEPQIVSRFLQEARAVNRIRHRNIVDVFAFDKLPDGRQYLVMELLEGQPLENILAERGKLGVREAYPILKAVADALDAAHAVDIAHRDLKPANIFVLREPEGHVTAKLLDFGVAKLTGEEGTQHKTVTGAAIGTPGYMSPEQCRGKNVDSRTDIYSFGVVMFEVLTGRRPFEGESAVDVFFKHIGEPPPAPSSIDPSVPRALDDAVLEALQKRPASRPASVGAALAALAKAAREVGLLPPDGETRPGTAEVLGGPATVRTSAAAPVVVTPPHAPEYAPTGELPTPPELFAETVRLYDSQAPGGQSFGPNDAVRAVAEARIAVAHTAVPPGRGAILGSSPTDAALTLGDAVQAPKRSRAALVVVGALVVSGLVGWLLVRPGATGSEAAQGLPLSPSTAPGTESVAAELYPLSPPPAEGPSAAPPGASATITVEPASAPEPSSAAPNAVAPARPAASAAPVSSAGATSTAKAPSPPKTSAPPAASAKPNRDTLLGGRD